MTAKEFSFDIEARNRMLAGVDPLANAVGLTLGPRGRNVVLESGSATPHFTKDGDTVARTFELEDRFENIVTRSRTPRERTGLNRVRPRPSATLPSIPGTCP